MIHIVAAIYFALGNLLFVLTNFQYYGPRSYEGFGIFLIIFGLILHIIGFVKQFEDKKSKQE